MPAYENQRYNTVKNFRVAEVETAFFIRPNPLYRPRPAWKVDPGFSYARISLPKGKFATVDAALAAYRKAFHVH